MGSYVQNNLLRDETVVYETKYHWIIFLTLRGLLSLFILPAIDRWSDEFVITNKRVVCKTGIISRKTLEMNLNKIESVNVDQSIAGRLLGYGSITIIGTGGTRETFQNIARAVEFRKKFQEIAG
ncbi:MAG: PH domain-containing protein [Chitinophagales bacterium]|nr:PH domain-containing protein [Chitinophagales bacterium]MDW8420146.1 PH domain-containing protein [Chitinophagales bacterium]